MGKNIKWVPGKSLSKECKEDYARFCDEISEFNLSDLLCKILYNRGIDSYEKVKTHLYMELCDMHNPSLLKDSDKFIIGIKKAIREKHKIIIMGDYDCDGVTSVSIAILALRNLGLDVDFYINNRFVEGYGMTVLSLENIYKKHPDVKTIITVDNGIVAFEAVEKAVADGIQVLVTDHHEPSADGKYPNAYAIVDQKREDCEYPFKELCGAGVIFKLMMLLYSDLGLDLDYIYELLDLLAVGTVADVVSLKDENRVFVREGLNLIRNNSRLFFEILNEKMGITKIDEETIGFQYGPAINAIGRLEGCPAIVVEAMISEDVEFISQVCEKMVKSNNDRKELSLEHEKKAESVYENQEDRDVIVVYNEEFLEGLVGIIAGRLCEKYYKPSVVLTKHGDIIKGSARSIPGFDIKDSFDYSASTLLKYGGHPQAGGLSLRELDLKNFVEKINEYASLYLTPEISKKIVYFDDVLSFSDINSYTVDEINKLKPYGQDFDKPIFGFKANIANEGFNENAKGDTLILKSTTGIKILGFHNKEQYISLNKPKKIAVLGCVSSDVYKGYVSYSFIIHEDNLKADNR